jgi:hypothetical protein
MSTREHTREARRAQESPRSTKANRSKHDGGNKFAGFIFACLRQIDADPKTSAEEFRLAYVISQYLSRKTKSASRSNRLSLVVSALATVRSADA